MYNNGVALCQHDVCLAAALGVRSSEVNRCLHTALQCGIHTINQCLVYHMGIVLGREMDTTLTQ